MKNILFLASVLILIFNSCCPNSCDCDDEFDYAIEVAFDRSIKTGYKIQEIDTIQIILLSLDLKVKESLIVKLDPISNNYYFGLSKIDFGFDINNNYYREKYQIRNYNIITQNLDTFFIRNIDVKGHKLGDRCCDCFTPERKIIDINNVHFEFITDENGLFDGSPILLKRK